MISMRRMDWLDLPDHTDLVPGHPDPALFVTVKTPKALSSPVNWQSSTATLERSWKTDKENIGLPSVIILVTLTEGKVHRSCHAAELGGTFGKT
jgi:hypothetical protein